MSATDAALAQRLDEMEVKLTFIDDAVQALTSADAEQSQRIAVLERALRDMFRELSAMRTAQVDDPQSEPPPPHY
ncbi:MAG: SlyX family protein [Pseudomonadota bacterium]|jgi:SlyX protein|nr:SlyX family protein [Xanthomonadaceae bacterium]MDE2248227.1 SlyX family protein [Xanthomonadaceae bacterium]MDE3209836.1 SlyX family protein [Pseudomonadota bacterium]